jgi:hypothetical protein
MTLAQVTWLEAVMKPNTMQGKTIRWTFSDGPMADKTFEHVFNSDGSVTWNSIDGAQKGKPSSATKSEIASVGKDVTAVSYLGPSGYTLTVVLDFRSKRLVAFASNEKQLSVQNGTFEVDGAERSLSV